MAKPECWGLYEMQYDEHPLRLRLNESIEEFICHPRYKHLLCITIPLNDVDENGFAHAEECKLLDEVELILRDQLEAQQLCVFVAAVTSDGFRLYLTYSSQVAACEDILAAVNQDWIYHSISSYAQEDRNWEALEALLELQPQSHF
jgi:aspartate-semialdehyde dehydrogenase